MPCNPQPCTRCRGSLAGCVRHTAVASGAGAPYDTRVTPSPLPHHRPSRMDGRGHLRSEGTRGMAMCQRDGRWNDTRSETKVTNCRPEVEPLWRASQPDTAALAAPGHETVQQEGPRRSWRL